MLVPLLPAIIVGFTISCIFTFDFTRKVRLSIRSDVRNMNVTMKKIYLFVVVIILSIILLASLLYACHYTASIIKKQEFQIQYQDSLLRENNLTDIKGISTLEKRDLLINAIAIVESRNDSTAKSSISSAAGHLQILKGTVDEANNILKAKGSSKRFSYDDRHSIKEAEEMWDLLQNKYNPQGDLEKAIRMWNGGPNYSVEATNEYYKRVRKVYDMLIDQKLDSIIREYKSLNY